MKKILISLGIFFSLQVHGLQTISLISPRGLLDTSITAITIADVQQLLHKACDCEVMLNNPLADVQLHLPEIDANKASAPNRFARAVTYAYKNYPEHDYAWKAETKSGKLVLTLEATSWQGVSFGLYGLLQEQLGFRFLHPRQTLIPSWKNFPVKPGWTFAGRALFDKKGFHLHTQHPIELTEPLLDEKREGALKDVKEYIDWLVRNGQTYFEFCLLESIRKKTWIAHAKRIVDYCHQRGILASVDVSLHMVQQKNFQLYKYPIGKKRQVEKNLKWITQADWDFINVEFTMAEFIAGNRKKREELRLFMIDWLRSHTNTKLMGRQHVVKPEKEAGHNRREYVWTPETERLDKERGVLAHTVMFYDMTEEHAPVYENENQRHMFEFLLQQMKVRETWYYPESAYWVTFDNSIPMLLLPYLNARLSDIDTCVAYQVPGHITFSSGWEWGYWLIDWSIARWSWQYSINDVPVRRTPGMYMREIVQGTQHAPFLELQLQLQQYYLKDKNLIQWLTAMTFLDETRIRFLQDRFQPRPPWSYRYLQRKADYATISLIREHHLPLLDSFYHQTYEWVHSFMSNPERAASQEELLGDELTDGVLITAWRARHRAHVLRYILCRREATLSEKKCNCDEWLKQAAAARAAAQRIVRLRENHYRYPLYLIAGKRKDHTAYHSGYLYTVSNLHFWLREEEQARRNNYSPFFKQVWNIWRIAGVID
ncbi:MAG: hypothetical protein NZM35_11420 [Chitinophagales bacterium]|nr:hypothetical protein [Chitinophagales bacterium]MDW8419956.1 hypothetical protein [Chitinophagales bacterium]